MTSSYLLTFQALKTPALFAASHSLESPLLKINQLENGQKALTLTTRKELGFLGRIWTWLGFGNASSRKIVAFLNSDEGYQQLSNLAPSQQTEISSKMIQLNKKFRSKLNNRILNIFLAKKNKCSRKELTIPAYFWKIENGKRETTYLLGTFHSSIAFKELHPVVKQALENSQHVAVENFSEPELIRHSLDKETWRKYKKIVRSDERNASKNLSSKVLKTLTERQLCKLLTHYSPNRMDADITEKARKKNKTLDRLDAAKENPSPTYYILAAMENPARWVETQKQVEELLMIDNAKSTYEEEKAVENLLKTRVYSEEDIRNLQQRNLNWMPLIESLIAKGNTFIAMGLAHLEMEKDQGKGILSLLKQKGYKLTKVTSNKTSNLA